MICAVLVFKLLADGPGLSAMPEISGLGLMTMLGASFQYPGRLRLTTILICAVLNFKPWATSSSHTRVEQGREIMELYQKKIFIKSTRTLLCKRTVFFLEEPF